MKSVGFKINTLIVCNVKCALYYVISVLAPVKYNISDLKQNISISLTAASDCGFELFSNLTKPNLTLCQKYNFDSFEVKMSLESFWYILHQIEGCPVNEPSWIAFYLLLQTLSDYCVFYNCKRKLEIYIHKEYDFK